MTPNTSLFFSVNDFARATPWLHGALGLYAGYGMVVFAGLLVAGWWIARRGADTTTMAAGLFLVNRRLGFIAALAAVLMGFSRVYIAAHFPVEVVAGLLLGAAVTLAG